MVPVLDGQVFVKQWSPAKNADKPPMMLLHESLGCVGLWRDFPAQLCQQLGRVVYAYDRLGFGRSSPREKIPSVNFVHEEATLYFPQIKAQLGLNRYLLLGHSMGGGMVLNIAANDRECAAVISIAAQVFVENLTLQGIKAAQTLFAQPSQFARLQKWHGNNAAWVLNAWTQVWLSEEFRDWSLATLLPTITCPVLAVHGDNDEYGSVVFPQQITEQTSGSGEMLILPGCGHSPHLEQAEYVLKAINAFINNHLV